MSEKERVSPSTLFCMCQDLANGIGALSREAREAQEYADTLQNKISELDRQLAARDTREQKIFDMAQEIVWHKPWDEPPFDFIYATLEEVKAELEKEIKS